MILEATLHYPSGASFNTMVKDLLGKGWNAVNGLSVAFVLYILTYAYISAGGSIIAHTLEASSASARPPPARCSRWSWRLSSGSPPARSIA